MSGLDMEMHWNLLPYILMTTTLQHRTEAALPTQIDRQEFSKLP